MSSTLQNSLVRYYQAGILVTFAALWEIASRSGVVDPDIIPPLSKVALTLTRLLHDERFLADVRVTAFECILGFAIVTPLGLGLGFLIGESEQANRALGGPLQLLMTVPKSVFLPVFVLMFGIGIAQKVIFAVVLAFFIVVPTGIAAVHSVPRGLVTATRSFGATRLQIYLRVYLPAMAPLVVGGARLGLIFVVHGVIFAEMYGATEGVGRSILTWGEAFQMDYLLAAVLLVLAFTVVLNAVMKALENLARARTGAVA
jgi:ABC-type nitrate/sulfonate/bicarbonate transport system permease component